MRFDREKIISDSKNKWDKLTKYRESVFFKCAKELKNITKQSIEIDHAISLKEGGIHHPDNMWPLPKNINRIKSSKSWERFSFDSWKIWFQRRIDIDSELLGEYNIIRFNEVCSELKNVWSLANAKAQNKSDFELEKLTNRNIEYVLNGIWDGEVLINKVEVYLNIISDKNVEAIIQPETKLPNIKYTNKNTGIQSSCIKPTLKYIEDGIIRETSTNRITNKKIVIKGSILKVYEFISAKDGNGKLNCYQNIKDIEGNSLTEILNVKREDKRL